MGNIFIDSDMGVPQIVCTDCGKCDSVMGRSLCKTTNRGCCHYFPEFTLVDIQRMACLENGRDALDIILSCPGTVVNRYNIYSKGTFEKESYEQYISSGNMMETGSIRDHTIFFRTCPFVTPGVGCKLPPRFRTTVCNFFICSEILEQEPLQNHFKSLLEERARYARWVYRESGVLEHLLAERSLNLISDFSASLDLLRDVGINTYEFPLIKPISYNSVLSSGSFTIPSTTSA